MLNLIWLIPLLPLAGVLINLFLGGRMGRRGVYVVGCGMVLLAFLVSLGAVWELSQLPHDQRNFDTEIATWMPLGEVAGKTMTVGWGFALDTLSSVLLLVVTGVGFLIHLYSTGYMSHEKDYRRFFLYLNLFMAMMLTLVLADNLLVLFVGWEGVGLCSYLLIGFFYDKPFDARTGLSCADAGRKAFIVNRIGDFAFLIGMLYLAIQFGTLKFSELNTALAHGGQDTAMLTAVGVLLFIGACGKSAQIPLFVWLPDAMAGPTPVSALIHAATMVTAGVYMVCRMSGLYAHTPDAMLLIATVGAATALFAATMGITATDIKKVLAYSTVSQLGFMFAAAGVGAYSAAMFHLMTHAFFKALLFLGAGSVIHGLSGEQDIRKMGGLRAKMPTTFWTFGVATLAIAGIFPLAGFFSKDEILAGAWNGNHKIVWAVLLVAAICTAFYMTRLTYLVFFGKFRGDKDAWSHAHESPRTMTVPLTILGLLSIAGGWIGIPKVITLGKDINFFHHWVDESIVKPGSHGGGHGAEAAAHHASVGMEWALIGIALTASIVGILFAVRIYK
ncbi:MAG: NADH-quinone oxidoreductase subunit L, partial [Acidobacteriota bacterium]|nr:NADH-quinone oxidoreductase subunit L [Acidobacteriota bacterium]